MSASFAMALRSFAYFSYGTLFYGRFGLRYRQIPRLEAALESEAPERVLAGKRIAITGANSGIGFETSLILAKLGATVLMLCRNREKGREAAQAIAQQLGKPELVDGNLKVVQLDVSDLESVHAIVENPDILSGPIDSLIHNAGCMVHKYSTTAQGLELNSATNIIGPYLLTKILLSRNPALLNSEFKTVFVTSGGALTQSLLSKIEHFQGTDSAMKKEFDGTIQYARNKRQQLALVEKWSQDYPEYGFYAWHPGWADTPALENGMPAFHKLMSKNLRLPEDSAKSLVELILTPNSELESGALYFDGKKEKKSFTLLGPVHTSEKILKMMTNLEELVKKKSQTSEENE